MPIEISKYQALAKSAVREFWDTRNKQKNNTGARNANDNSNRSSVTGGKQLDGFLKLLKKVSTDLGVPSDCIYTRGNQLPGYFRATKEWDFLIISPQGKVVVIIELKSQVGSFGNNFNNRTEEALGSALDLWTAYREHAFPDQASPWLGYLLLVEKSPKSMEPVRVSEPYFKVFPEFQNTSYLDRYKIFCQKLMLERHYSHCCLLWTSPDYLYGNADKTISLDSFLYSLTGHLSGHLHEFNPE